MSNRSEYILEANNRDGTTVIYRSDSDVTIRIEADRLLGEGWEVTVYQRVNWFR